MALARCQNSLRFCSSVSRLSRVFRKEFSRLAVVRLAQKALWRLIHVEPQTPEDEPSAKVRSLLLLQLLLLSLFGSKRDGSEIFVAYLALVVYLQSFSRISHTNTHVVASQTAGVQKDVLAA